MKIDYKKDFPLFENRRKLGKKLIYFDNAATTQKPQQVMQAITYYYENYTANPHRGAYQLSSEATDAYEGARAAAAGFIGAETEEIVFTAGTTASINMLAMSLCADYLEAGDEILVSIAEHHSNLLPWQRAARLTGARLRYLYVDKNGRIPQEELTEKLNKKTKIVALAHVSNVLGSVNPLAGMIRQAHEVGAVVVVDAAQSAPHMKLDVKQLDADFLAFSGHKMLGPAGIGVLYGKKTWLDRLEPVIVGGGIVEEVTEDGARYLEAPWKFEAGTPNVEGAVGLQAAIDYIGSIGLDTIGSLEAELTEYALDRMGEIPGLTVYGDTACSQRAGIISFNIDDAHPHDVASILDADGVAIRAGHHCAQPLLKHLGVSNTCRMSLYFYNTREEIDLAVKALKKVRGVLGYANQ